MTTTSTLTADRIAERRAALRLQDLAELLLAPVGQQELEPGLGAQPPVAVVAEDGGDGLPDVGHVLCGDPDAGALRHVLDHLVARVGGIEPRKGGIATPWFELDASGKDQAHKDAAGATGRVAVWGAFFLNSAM